MLTHAKQIAYSNRIKDKIILKPINDKPKEAVSQKNETITQKNETMQNGSQSTKTESDKLSDETNYLISSIYLFLDVIKRPLLLNNYLKLLEEIRKVNVMIKKIEENNLVKEEYVIKIRDNIGEAILAAAIHLYAEYGSYNKSCKLLQMAKKMARSRGTINKIILEMNVLEDSQRSIDGTPKKNTTYSVSNNKEEIKSNNGTNQNGGIASNSGSKSTSFVELNNSNNKTGNNNQSKIMGGSVKSTVYTPQSYTRKKEPSLGKNLGILLFSRLLNIIGFITIIFAMALRKIGEEDFGLNPFVKYILCMLIWGLAILLRGYASDLRVKYGLEEKKDKD